MSDTPATAVPESPTLPPPSRRGLPTPFAGRASTWLFLLIGVVVVSLVRVLTDANDITSTNTFRAALLSACPILLAGLGGVWSERAGVVNIGLEGQMLLGTWGAAYFTYWYGPWIGILGAALCGLIGGVIHGLATVTFGVDQIVAGVALNIIALGATIFLARAFFSDYENGGPTQLTGLDPLPRITIPGLSDGLVSLNNKHWFLLSDIAGALGALVTNMSVLSLITIALIVVTSMVLWRTRFGLRLRSCGESPEAAESLGVSVYLYKYAGVLVSGAFAGVGGGFLALVSAGGFTTNQSGGRGYIGLASMIFGNWMPGGTAGASFMFGYTDALRLRDPGSVHALLLLVALGLFGLAAWRLYRRNVVSGLVMLVMAAGFLVWFLTTDTVPREFTGMTPYVATLLVLALASQRMRMPAADGRPYRRGSAG